MQGRDLVFLHQKAKLNFRAIVSTALLWLQLAGLLHSLALPIDTSLWKSGAAPCFLPVRKAKGLKRKIEVIIFWLVCLTVPKRVQEVE